MLFSETFSMFVYLYTQTFAQEVVMVCDLTWLLNNIFVVVKISGIHEKP